jgi:hypothetical protein
MVANTFVLACTTMYVEPPKSRPNLVGCSEEHLDEDRGEFFPDGAGPFLFASLFRLQNVNAGPIYTRSFIFRNGHLFFV